MWNRKRRRDDPRSIHPRNFYADKPPDFGLLASLYPSFQHFVFSSRSGRPAIDWKDYNATRELTRVLLLHDHGINWWIPDGQLCPTVPNRLNYIHWINDLLSSDLIPKRQTSNNKVKGFDIGTGANCIYPLLGASLLGWEFVGSDVTKVALEWATKNVESNPKLSELIEIRDATDPFSGNNVTQSTRELVSELPSKLFFVEKDESQGQELKECGTVQPRVLLGVVKEGETFDFCMCNPPFFESIEEAGLNPKTSCGGTTEEMVCPGGEITFVTQIIEDSVVLKCSFRWFTVMIGRKINLKSLMSKLREVGVSIVKTTEFVQGRTARWGLAWSFMPPCKDFISSTVALKSHFSFTLEGLNRQCGAFQVLKTVESFFLDKGVPCKVDSSSFYISVNLYNVQYNTANEMGLSDLLKDAENHSTKVSNGSSCAALVSVFEQIPGTILVRCSPVGKDGTVSGLLSSLFIHLEEYLRKELSSKSHGSFHKQKSKKPSDDETLH